MLSLLSVSVVNIDDDTLIMLSRSSPGMATIQPITASSMQILSSLFVSFSTSVGLSGPERPSSSYKIQDDQSVEQSTHVTNLINHRYLCVFMQETSPKT